MLGAVPTGFSIVTAPDGESAWRRLDCTIDRPSLPNRPCSAATSSGRRSSGRPVAAARPSRVTSSWVGPNPPHTTTTSARSRASPSAPAIRATSSPTAVWASTSTPTRASASEIRAALLLTIWPAISSEPTATTSASTKAWPG